MNPIQNKEDRRGNRSFSVASQRLSIRFGTKGNHPVIFALALAACTPAAPRIVTQQVVVDRPVACLSADDAAKLRALVPGDIGPWIGDAAAREGIYVGRLSRYRAFTDAALAVLLGPCVKP